jgi:NhaP-type Na+/H+ or K+/H+ antiporter
MDIISLIIFLAVGALVGWLCIRFSRHNNRRVNRLYIYGHYWRCYFVIYNKFS